MRTRFALVLLFIFSFPLMLASCGGSSSAPASAVDQVKAIVTKRYRQVQDFKVTFAEKMETTDADKSNGITERWCLAGTVSRNVGGNWQTETFREHVEQVSSSWSQEYNILADMNCKERSRKAEK